jgi:branched-chain amino acid transport system substrate-binding protein
LGCNLRRRVEKSQPKNWKEDTVMIRIATRFFTAAVALAVAAVPALSAAQVKDVKIALIAPFSGPWARQGDLMLKGAQMAIDDINAQGGIKALGGAKLKLIVIDAGDNIEKAKNAAQRMVAQETEVIGCTGAWLSSFTLAVTEVTERAELPCLTLSYSDQITARGFRYIFQTSPTGNEQATQALPTIMKLAESTTGHALKTVAIVMDNTAASVSFAKPMREGGLAKAGLSILVDETFTPPLSDATSLVQKVRSARPDLLFLLPTALPDDKLLVEKLNEFGLGRGRLPVVSNGAHIAAPEMLTALGKEQVEGIMTVVGNWHITGEEALLAEYKKRTGEPWMTQETVSTYGDLWIFKEALERARAPDRRKVADAIRTLDLTDGPARFYPGGRVKFDDKGRRVGATLLIVQWQNGAPETVFPPANATAKPIWPKQ